MKEVLITIAISIVIIVLGAINMTGNISTLHHYHRKRVKEEDIKPFGKKIGLGLVIIGVAMIFFGAFNGLALYTQNKTFSLVGTIVFIAGLVVGLIFAFYAMIKYNKGIF